jgi:Na+/H+ antiporter NhaD/arsenite permease-like protein
MMSADLHHKPAILIILVLTYTGIALGHIPGLKLNRTGIALLGAIGMMIFGGVSTSEVVSYINWPPFFCFSVSLSFRRNCVSRDFMIWWAGAFRPGSAIPPNFYSS